MPGRDRLRLLRVEISTPASPTTSGIAVTSITTGTQPASIASATARPKPSWREAWT